MMWHLAALPMVHEALEKDCRGVSEFSILSPEKN